MPLVLYGTQTGNAEEAAAELAAAFPARCVSAQFYDAACLAEEDTVLVVVSTYGDGEAPDAFAALWRHLLRRDLPSNWLCHTRFAVFGLGDSAYPKYNAVARRLDKRLEQLGAVRRHALGLGDGDSWEEAFATWKLSLLGRDTDQAARGTDEAHGALHTPARSGVQRLVRGAKFLSLDELTPAACGSGGGGGGGDGSSDDAQTPVNDLKRVVQVNIGVPPDTSFTPGDVAYILPRNRRSTVDAFFTLFPTLHPDAPYLLTEANIVVPARDVVARYFDLNAVPRRRFLRRLASFVPNEEASASAESDANNGRAAVAVAAGAGKCAPDRVARRDGDTDGAGGQTAAMERQRLLEIANNTRFYRSYAVQEQRTVLLVLRDFPAARPPTMEHLLELMPRLQPRGYSIASASTTDGRVELCVRMVRYVTPLRRLRVGVASAYFDELRRGEPVPMWIQRGVLRMPAPDVPWLMIAVGTGIGVFRCMASRVRTLGYNGDDKVMVFGCRRPNEDDLYVDAPVSRSMPNGHATASASWASKNADRPMHTGGGHGGDGGDGNEEGDENDDDNDCDDDDFETEGDATRAHDDDVTGSIAATKAASPPAHDNDSVWPSRMLRVTAYSRISSSSSSSSAAAAAAAVPAAPDKTYVQQKIRDEAPRIHARCFRDDQSGTALYHRAVIMVAGSSASNMPGEVRRAIRDAVLRDCGGLSEDAAETVLRDMVRDGRYMVEVWS